MNTVKTWTLSIPELIRISRQRAIANKSPAHARAIAYFERVRADDRLWK